MIWGFALVGQDDTTWSPAYAREDRDVFSIRLRQAEGGFALLSVLLVNDHSGLGTLPNKWMWLSRDGSPVCFGRIVKAAEELQEDLIVVNILCRPRFYADLKKALADTLKTHPHYDRVWVSPNDEEDPDVVLEARSALWHVDRISHDLTISDITAGEDGTLEISEADVIEDSLRFSRDVAPVRRCEIKAQVSWDQIANGPLDVSGKMLSAFRVKGSPSGVVSSFTGEGYQRDSPDKGASLRGGWFVNKYDLKRLDGVSRPRRYHDVPIADVSGNTVAGLYWARFYIWEFRPSMVLGYEVERQRIETVEILIEADVQDVVTDADEDVPDRITRSTSRVQEPIDPGDALPIRQTYAPSYLNTFRGRLSLEYLILLGRSRLISRARCVNVTWRMRLDDALALGITLRKSAHIVDRRLPDGEATGKIIEYEFYSEDGLEYAEITIGCLVGTGEILVATPGTGTYATDGYMATGYQRQEGALYSPSGIEDFTYGGFDIQIIDDGVNFYDMRVEDLVLNFETVNGESAQRTVLTPPPGTAFNGIDAAIAKLNAKFTESVLDLKPLVGGPFKNHYPITTSRLYLPKQINIEAI